MHNSIIDIDKAKELIASGRTLLLAGDEIALRKLPKGNWLGGTIPYFISETYGGMASRSLIFSTDITDFVKETTIVQYDHTNLSKVFCDGSTHDFSFIVIPYRSITHLAFALNAPKYQCFGLRPLIGWISGVHLDDLGEITPKIINGSTGSIQNDGAFVLHADLLHNYSANANIINLFEQGDGDELSFTADSFSSRDVVVNGTQCSFIDYIKDNNIDTNVPLVAIYNSIAANTSFQTLDEATDEVTFYAPVFKDVIYKLARPIASYETEFGQLIKKDTALTSKTILFSCNCILNYMYSGLEGKTTGIFSGPITFGEIANRLLNQTLVYLEISDKHKQ